MSGGRTQSRLRRSELAGWRTRSLYPSPRVRPTSSQRFLPILKLRGLPYFCTQRQVLGWFGEMAAFIHQLILIPEVEPLNSGFALAIMNSADAAMTVWRHYHKEVITSRRFVEVFTLVPPNCPLVKRGAPQPAPTDVSQGYVGDLGVCEFCGHTFDAHGDRGVGSLACSRLRRLVDGGCLGISAQGLMPCAFLEIPALLYQDNTTRQELEAFKPYARNEPGLYTLEELERSALGGSDFLSPKGTNIDTLEFYDISRVSGYDLRALLCEIICILAPISQTNSLDEYPHSHQQDGGVRYVMRIVDIGNRLSTKARAYLFIVEIKLQGILERFPEIFSMWRYTGVLWVSVCGDQPDALKVLRGPSFDLSLRKRRKAKRPQIPKNIDACLGDDWTLRSLGPRELLSPTTGGDRTATSTSTTTPLGGALSDEDELTNLLFDQLLDITTTTTATNTTIPQLQQRRPRDELEHASSPLTDDGLHDPHRLQGKHEDHKFSDAENLHRQDGATNSHQGSFARVQSAKAYQHDDWDIYSARCSPVESQRLDLDTDTGGTLLWGDEEDLPLELERHCSALAGGRVSAPLSSLPLARHLSALAAPIAHDNNNRHLIEGLISSGSRCVQTSAIENPLALVRSITDDPSVFQVDQAAGAEAYDHEPLLLDTDDVLELEDLYRSVTSPVRGWEAIFPRSSNQMSPSLLAKSERPLDEALLRTS